MSSLLCWIFGHDPDEELRHSFCSKETEMTFCRRCPQLFKEKNGEWVPA